MIDQRTKDEIEDAALAAVEAIIADGAMMPDEMRQRIVESFTALFELAATERRDERYDFQSAVVRCGELEIDCKEPLACSIKIDGVDQDRVTAAILELQMDALPRLTIERLLHPGPKAAA